MSSQGFPSRGITLIEGETEASVYNGMYNTIWQVSDFMRASDTQHKACSSNQRRVIASQHV